jgi:hypothetical protein
VIQTVFRVMLFALLRDRGALALAFILPPLIFVIFATVFAGASGNELEIAMAFADEAKTPGARELVKALRASTVLRIADEALSADEVRSHVVAAFPGAEVSWAPHLKRQNIVDSWPADVDDSAARRDWGYAPRYDEQRAFAEYLIPTIRERYR